MIEASTVTPDDVWRMEEMCADAELALIVAPGAGVPLFAVQATHSVYELAAREGLGRQDYAAIARLWERWLGRPLAGE